VNDRDLILGSLPDAHLEVIPRASQVGDQEVRDVEELWRRFAERLEGLSGRLATKAEWDLSRPLSFWVDADAMEFVRDWNVKRADSPWSADVGVTTADVAVAETGSIAISAGPGRRRLASLAPPIHVALVSRNAIVATLEEAVQRMSARTSVIVTGPSRTADIEGILVRGVHGPRELWVFRLNGGQIE
jgi:hypothetical protein